MYWWWYETKSFYIYINIFYKSDLLFTKVNRFHNNRLPRRIAEIFYQQCKLSVKLHKAASSIGFSRKTIYNQVTPNVAKVQGHFSREELLKETYRKLLYEHLSKHYQDSKELCKKYELNKGTLRKNPGPLLSKFLLIQMRYKQLNERSHSFKTKNKKLQNLLSNNSTIRIKYSVPVVNLSNNCLAEKEPFQLSFGL